MMRKQIGFLLVACLLWTSAVHAQPDRSVIVSILATDGRVLTGSAENVTLHYLADGQSKSTELKDMLSFHSAMPASEIEVGVMERNLDLLGTEVSPASEAAAAKLTDIGLPVMSLLLKGYQDSTYAQPDYRYRLFGRIIPGHLDVQDRTLGLIRLASGESFRGNLQDAEFEVQTVAGGAPVKIASAQVRRLAVQRAEVQREFELQALLHCTYVGFLDTGIITTASSRLRADAKGFVRLSFDEDGWATDPHGIVDPLPGKRKLQEGFRWGSVLGRVGPEGDRWFVGRHLEKSDLGTDRLYFVINDNEHWQNNIGGFRVRISVTNAFDVGEPY